MIKSGIYVVELINGPFYSNAHEPLPENQGTLLYKGDTKFGKSKNLELRYKNYLRTFGEGNFIFEPMIYTNNIDVIEKLIKLEVNKYRIVGIHKRRLEWLRGIKITHLKKIVNKFKSYS